MSTQPSDLVTAEGLKASMGQVERYHVLYSDPDNTTSTVTTSAPVTDFAFIEISVFQGGTTSVGCGSAVTTPASLTKPGGVRFPFSNGSGGFVGINASASGTTVSVSPSYGINRIVGYKS